MSESEIRVFRFNSEAKTRFEAVIPIVRQQAILTIILATIMVVTIILALLFGNLVGGFQPLSLAFALVLFLPAGLVLIAVKRLRRPPVFNPIAVTLAGPKIVFGEREFPGIWPIRRSAEEWERSATDVRIIPGNSFVPARIQFTTPRRRPHSFAVDFLDAPPDEIIAAVQR